MMDASSSSAHTLIVGGGIAGCTLLHALAKRGKPVTLLEGGRIGRQGASAVPVALLNPYRGRSAQASDLDRSGLEATWQLVRALEAQGLEPGVRQSGVLRIASNARQAKLWRKREGLQWLEPADVPEAYHAPFGAALVPNGGWLEPRKLLAALVEAAKRHWARVREECFVEGLEPQWEGFAVRTNQGTFRARTVVFCVGASQTPGVQGPALERIAGDVVGLRSTVDLPLPIAGAVYGAKTSDLLYLGGNHRPAGEDDPTAPMQLQRAGSWFIPSLEQAERVSVWTGVRARTDDNVPLVTELRPNLWFFGGLAGRGFLCAAYLSEQLAHIIRPLA
jgi:glycine/D-amino acid oxidase-like deaminating enzyme